MLDRKYSRRGVLRGGTGLAVGLAASHSFRPFMVSSQDKQPVTAWTTHSDDDLACLQKIVDEFNGQSSTTQVTLTQVPGSETDAAKLITAVRGGTGPDAYMLDRFTVAERAAGGMLQDLSDLLQKQNFDPDLTKTYVEFAASEAMWDGKPYALPFDSDARGLFINSALFKEAGADLTKFTLDADPVTWDELKDIASKINKTASSGNFDRVGFVPWAEQGSAYTWGFSYGASFFDKDNCQVTPTDAKMVEAEQWVYDYAKEFDPAALAAAITTQEGAPPTENPFLTQRNASIITGDWMLATMTKYAPDMEYQIAKIPVPKAGDESVTWAGGWSWVIPQGSKNTEGAAEFIAYMAGEPGQKVYTKDTSHLPTVAKLQDQTDLFDEAHAQFAKVLLPLAKNRPPLPVGAKYWDELGSAHEKIYLNQEEPQQALQTCQDNVNQVLQQFCPIN